VNQIFLGATNFAGAQNKFGGALLPNAPCCYGPVAVAILKEVSGWPCARFLSYGFCFFVFTYI